MSRTGVPLRQGRLFRKYVVIFVVLVSGGLLTSGLIELYFAYQENQRALVGIQREKASAAAFKIEQFISAIEPQISLMNQALRVLGTASPEQRRDDYRALLNGVPSITEIGYLDASGKEQLRVSRLALDVLRSAKDYSQDVRFLQAKAGKTYFGLVTFRNDSEPYMTIAVPEHGADAGVSVAEVNLKFIWDVVTEIKVGEQGYAYVVDDTGHLIAHPEISLVLKKTDLAALPQVQAARAGNARPVDTREATIGRDLQGRQVLSAYEAVNATNWYVFVDQPVEEAFAPLFATVLRIGVLLIVGVVVSVIASLFLAQRMVAPIQTLQATAARIGAGALDQHIEIRTGDELESLADEFNHMTVQLKDLYDNLEHKVEDRTRELRLEQEKSERLLLNILPKAIADRLKQSPGTIADSFAEVTVLFADIVGFTPFSATVTPIELVNILNDIFSAFDQLAEQHGLEKIKTIGDSYMIVGGLPLPRPDHAEAIADMALAMQKEIARFNRDQTRSFSMRIGINTGPVVAGVIGTKKFIYDLWGDTVNIASRMESQGAGGVIQVTEATYEQLQGKYQFGERRAIEIKGKGQMTAYMLLGKL